MRKYCGLFVSVISSATESALGENYFRRETILGLPACRRLLRRRAWGVLSPGANPFGTSCGASAGAANFFWLPVESFARRGR